MELYEQLLMEIQDGLQAVRDEQSGLEQVRKNSKGGFPWGGFQFVYYCGLLVCWIKE